IVEVEAASGRVPCLLDLALTVSGAERALLVRQDGVVAISAGAPLQAVSDADLAKAAQASADRVKGAGFFAAVEIRSPEGARLGALALAAGGRLKPTPRLAETLRQLAGLCAAALEGAAPDGLADAERNALVAEIDHRVRNVLAAVQSMASQSARRAGSLDGFLKAFSGRLKAMASAHELLTATRGRGASILDLATGALSNLAPGQTRWEGPDLFLTSRAASALSLALHELAMNAVKHGALSRESGRVMVRWRGAEDGGFDLEWGESGGPQVPSAIQRGFGAVLLEEVAARELEGEVSIELRSSGLRAHIHAAPEALADEGHGGFRMERTRPEAAPPPAPAPAGRAGKVEGMKVIIVEDAILLAMELEAGLQEAGVEVIGSAALVDEAMALVDTPMDAAVLDCNLNGESVIPVAEALAARGVPFLFATGYGESRGAPEGFDAPIIRKPYDVAQITSALADITGRS
ncbi:MAG TPA: HWE histidine kinase domain-containing protein, partial [Caulobacteraceae bacterium]|nr:HWE histidine kinase domain-containing protein [Caulobacteraceae bacterium]